MMTLKKVGKHHFALLCTTLYRFHACNLQHSRPGGRVSLKFRVSARTLYGTWGGATAGQLLTG